MTSATNLPYDRKILTDILVHHWRDDIKGCGCGWAVLGASHPEHVADVYEAAVAARSVEWLPANRRALTDREVLAIRQKAVKEENNLEELIFECTEELRARGLNALGRPLDPPQEPIAPG